jgi:hypothetical protein
MQATEVDQEIIDLEQEFWDAIRERDNRSAAMTDDPCLVTGAQGASEIDRAQFSRLLESDTWKLHEYEFRDVHVRRLTDDVAVIAYIVREKLTVEGKPLTLEAADASTWVRRGGKWYCALHTESVLGDPFGRDRVSNDNTRSN